MFFILLFVRTRKRFHGQVLLTYLFLYPILRSFIELLRGDKARGEYTSSALPSPPRRSSPIIIAMIAAVTLAYLIRKKGSRPSDFGRGGNELLRVHPRTLVYTRGVRGCADPRSRTWPQIRKAPRIGYAPGWFEILPAMSVDLHGARRVLRDRRIRSRADRL